MKYKKEKKNYLVLKTSFSLQSYMGKLQCTNEKSHNVWLGIL